MKTELNFQGQGEFSTGQDDVSSGENHHQKQLQQDNFFGVILTQGGKSFSIVNDTSTASSGDVNEQTFLELDKTESTLSSNSDKGQFTQIAELGRGSYGLVNLVQKANGSDKGRYYAMKRIKKSQLIQRKQLIDNVVNEMNVLSSLNHPMLSGMHYAYQSQKYLYFVLDYCPGGELFYYLQQIGRFKERAARFYAANVLLGLKHLHSLNILYRDLKPENLMVDQNGYLKLIDFGFSTIMNDAQQTDYRVCGTPEYIPPEVLAGKGYSIKSEWWAFGCLIYELLVGIQPFAVSTQDTNFHLEERNELYYLIQNSTPNFASKYLSPMARDLLEKLLQKDPLKRPDINEIMNHSWFSTIDWTALEQMTVKPVYKPPLSSESDTQFFSKEFTQQLNVLNPEDPNNEQIELNESSDQLMEVDLECLYNVRTADEADNSTTFDNFSQVDQ